MNKTSILFSLIKKKRKKKLYVRVSRGIISGLEKINVYLVDIFM